MKWPPAHESAREEFREIVQYLRTNVSANLARRFTLSAMETVQVARDFPESGSPIGIEARRLRIRPFSYDLIYLAEGDEIYIIAFAHHRRQPGYWTVRL